MTKDMRGKTEIQVNSPYDRYLYKPDLKCTYLGLTIRNYYRLDQLYRTASFGDYSRDDILRGLQTIF